MQNTEMLTPFPPCDEYHEANSSGSVQAEKAEVDDEQCAATVVNGVNPV